MVVIICIGFAKPSQSYSVSTFVREWKSARHCDVNLDVSEWLQKYQGPIHQYFWQFSQSPSSTRIHYPHYAEARVLALILISFLIKENYKLIDKFKTKCSNSIFHGDYWWMCDKLLVCFEIKIPSRFILINVYYDSRELFKS